MNKPFEENQFTPNYAVPPGDILTEELANRGMSKEELAEYTGISPKTISAILSGECPITPEIALKLEPIFQLPVHLWINLEQRYQEVLTRLVESENVYKIAAVG